jgi:hypothetical protein
LLGVVRCALAAPGAAAEKVNLDPIANQLAVDIRNSATKSVAVADFRMIDGKRCDLGWYLASKLSDDLAGKAQGFRLLDRAELADSKVTAEDLGSAEALKRIGQVWGVAAIVMGTIEVSD